MGSSGGGAFALAAWLLYGAGGRSAGRDWLTTGLLAAICASLVHALLSFALLTPGGLAMFALCAAGAATWAQPAEARVIRGSRLMVAIVGAGALVAYFGLILLPMSATAAALDELDRAARAGRPLAAAERVVAVSQHDPAAARAAARTLLHMAAQVDDAPADRRREWLAAASECALTAAKRDPLDSGTRALVAEVSGALARFERARGNDAAADEHLESAARAWSEAVARYPTNPRTRIIAGQAWLALWQRTHDVGFSDVAREDFERARAIDQQRPPNDVVRLRQKELDEIDSGLRALPPVSPVPASAPAAE